MRLRTLLAIAPLVALISLAVILRDESGAAHVLTVVGFSYMAIVTLALIRHRHPPESHPMLPKAAPKMHGDYDRPLLDRLESAIILSQSSGSDYERRLRPILFRVATGRLSARGVSWEREPEKAEALLGAQTWQFIRPPEDSPDRDAHGRSIEEIVEIVNRIEEV